MGSLIEELRRREDAARAEADRLRIRIEELSEDLARAEEQASRLAIACEEVTRVMEEPAAAAPSAGQAGQASGEGRACFADRGGDGAARGKRAPTCRCCRGSAERAGAASTKSRRPGTAGSAGRGERSGKAYERNRCCYVSSPSTSSNPVVGAENLCHLGRCVLWAPSARSRVRYVNGRSRPRRVCDGRRLMGLKLVFLIVTRAVSLLVAGPGVAGAARRDDAHRAPRRDAADRDPGHHRALAPRHHPPPVGAPVAPVKAWSAADEPQRAVGGAEAGA